MTLDRIVAFSGVHNFRDLGGYRTLDGRATRWGQLFRSDAMHDLTLEDLELFRTLGITSIVDLRSSHEVERTGRGLLEGETQRFVHSPVLTSEESSERGIEPLDSGYLSRRYLQYLDVGAPAIARVFEEMAEPENYPLVFNCFFGKDRTGVLAALVLSVLGVERDDIVDDYAITGSRVPFIVEKLRLDPIHRETIDRTDPELLAARAATMSTFLAEVDERCGGVQSWAHGAGIPADHLERMRGILLE